MLTIGIRVRPYNLGAAAMGRIRSGEKSPAAVPPLKNHALPIKAIAFARAPSSPFTQLILNPQTPAQQKRRYRPLARWRLFCRVCESPS
jgi:hypothetical protein